MTDNTSQKEYLKVENESRQPSLEDFYKWFESNREELLAAAQYNQEINSKLREEFIEEWPLERLQTMTIDEYVIGKGSQNQSLCYLIEQGKYKHLYIGIGGGAASKFGIYWSKKKNAYVDHRNQVISEEQIKEKFTNLKNDLYEIISAGISFDFDNSVFDTRNTRNSFFTRSAMIIKLLCIYSGGEPFFGVNINSYQKEFWSKLLPLPTQGGVYRQNHELVEIIQNKYPELNGSILGGTLHQYFREYIEEKEVDGIDEMIEEEKQLGVKNKYVNYLEKSYNLIFRGAPGTGKTYLAKQIAATIVTDGRVDTYAELSDEEKSRIGFVQFHPSYDYTDFVEGLRPTPSVGGNIGFELKSGVFKGFCDRARKNVGIGGQDNFEQAWDNYLDFVNTSEEKEYLTKTSYLTVNSRQNFLVNYDSGASGWTLPRQYVYKLYKNRNYDEQSYYKSGGKTVLETLKIRFGLEDYKAPTDLKTDCKFVFIIDEINRGEISKIFGELFFSLDPGYRGEEGAVLTQYANLHEDPEEKFYIPENVYIIGTMNDIDRSVDTFDFAMRRRFRLIEITADERTEMLEGLGDKKEEAISRMTSLNQAISEVEGLNSHYHVGPAYFLKLKSMSFEELWTDQLEPLLEDYVRGSYKEDEIMAQFRKAYYRTPIGVDGDE